MNKKTKLVLDLLKPKAKSLGFTKEELEGVAEKIADNLGLDDDATDEALTAAATKAVDAQMFYLELSQKSANRIIQKNKEEREAAEAEAKKKAEEEAAAKAEKERKAKEEAERNENENLQKLLDSEWAKGIKSENAKLAKMIEDQKAEFASMMSELNAVKAERVKAQRENKLKEILEGTGVFGERIKKNYAKMSFDTDADFDEFVSGVQEDINAFNQERADKGLDKLGIPATGEKTEDGKVEPMSDAEVEALAAIM